MDKLLMTQFFVKVGWDDAGKNSVIVWVLCNRGLYTVRSFTLYADDGIHDGIGWSALVQGY